MRINKRKKIFFFENTGAIISRQENYIKLLVTSLGFLNA
jgi:hypothetical protein